jgi:hypothetical protein
LLQKFNTFQTMALVRRIVQPRLPPVYEVHHGNRLHRQTVFSRPFICDDVRFYSVEQMIYSALLGQHHLFLEVKQLWFWDKYAHCVNNPCDIRPIVDHYLLSKDITLRAQWILSIRSVLERILISLLHDESSDLRESFEYIYQTDGTNLRFVEVTGSDTERIFSSGHSPRRLPLHPSQYAGANIYGDVLTDVYMYYFKDFKGLHYDHLPSFERLITRSESSRCSYDSTAVVVSDSNWRQGKDIQGGEFWYQSGFKFKDLAVTIRKKHGSLIRFKFVLVCGGTMDSKLLHTEEQWMDSWRPFAQLLEPLRDHPETIVVFTTGIGVPSLPRLRKWVVWFRGVLNADFGGCENILLVDWSIPNDYNFFLTADDNIVPEFLEHGKNFTWDHANQKGTRRMWQTIGRRIREVIPYGPDLRVIGLTTTRDCDPARYKKEPNYKPYYQAGDLKSRQTLM